MRRPNPKLINHSRLGFELILNGFRHRFFQSQAAARPPISMVETWAMVFRRCHRGLRRRRLLVSRRCKTISNSSRRSAQSPTPNRSAHLIGGWQPAERLTATNLGRPARLSAKTTPDRTSDEHDSRCVCTPNDGCSALITVHTPGPGARTDGAADFDGSARPGTEMGVFISIRPSCLSTAGHGRARRLSPPRRPPADVRGDTLIRRHASNAPRVGASVVPPVSEPGGRAATQLGRCDERTPGGSSRFGCRNLHRVCRPATGDSTQMFQPEGAGAGPVRARPRVHPSSASGKGLPTGPYPTRGDAAVHPCIAPCWRPGFSRHHCWHRSETYPIACSIAWSRPVASPAGRE
jgi:hypothetical protein